MNGAGGRYFVGFFNASSIACTSAAWPPWGARARYFLSAEELPPDARYVILPKQLSARFTQNPRWKNARFQTLSEIVDNERKEFVLLEKRPEMRNDK